MPIETYKCLIFRGLWSVRMDGLQIRITRCIVIGRLSKQQQDIRRGHLLTLQTFALLPEMACCCFESRPFGPITNLVRLDICKFQLAFSARRLLLNSVKEKYIMYKLSLFRCNVIWRGCDSRSSGYSIDFCQRLSQLVELTVKVTSLVLFLAVNHHANPNYGR
jgi:hypothetical protein